MSKLTTLQDIFNNSYESIVNDDGTSGERFNEDLAKQAILDLLESKAVDYYVIDEGGYEASKSPIQAIPLSALRELGDK
jgi:hypothetical protein